MAQLFFKRDYCWLILL